MPHRTTRLAAALALLVAVVGCGYDGPMITVQELKSGLDDPAREITVIDVRSAAEFAKGHVPGAINYPLQSLQKESDTIAALDGEAAVICNCGKGALAAAKQLRTSGVTVILVEGGYREWKAAGYPLAIGGE